MTLTNVRITDLPAITSSLEVTSNDVLPIVDIETSITKKVTVEKLANYVTSTIVFPPETQLTVSSSVSDVLNVSNHQISADDPGTTDRIIFWDESAGKLTHLDVNQPLSIVGNQLSCNETQLTLNTNITEVLNVSNHQISADDPGSDKIVFWDDSETKLRHLSLGDGLQIDGTVLSVTSSGGGGGGIETQLTAAATISDIISVSNHEISADSAGTDKIVFWDHSESKLAYLTIGDNLNINTTTLSGIGRPLAKITTYTNPGTGIHPISSGVSYLYVRVVGGGAGGGGASGSVGDSNVGGGGGSGGYAEKYFPVSTDTLFGYKVGSGGAGGDSSGGIGDPGEESFISGSATSTVYVRAYGGAGGEGGNSSTVFIAGGVGTTLPLTQYIGDVKAPGTQGGFGILLSKNNYISGQGGSSFFGGGAGPRTETSNGTNAQAPGAGGSGAACYDDITGRTGGKGAFGVVQIFEFY